MIKKILPLIVLVLIISCAPFINTAKLNSLKPGITRSEFIKDFGEPKGTNYYDGYYFLSYFVAKDAMDDYREYYFAFDKNDRLVGWKAQDDNAVRSTGMILSVPLPASR